MMSIDEFTGIHYNFRTMNCWHFVRLVRSDAGLSTPEFDVASPRAIDDAFDAGHADTKGLEQAAYPQNYDVVLMGERRAGRVIWHAGVYYDGCVSHCHMSARQSRRETLDDIRRDYQEIEFWR